MNRFRYGLDPLCLAGCAAYALNRWILKAHWNDGFLHGQFNDFWLIPCALPPVLWLQRHLGLRHHDRFPTWGEILGHVVLWSVLFEWIGPSVMPVTGDPWDVLAYLLGGLTASWWWHRAGARASFVRPSGVDSWESPREVITHASRP